MNKKSVAIIIISSLVYVVSCAGISAKCIRILNHAAYNEYDIINSNENNIQSEFNVPQGSNGIDEIVDAKIQQKYEKNDISFEYSPEIWEDRKIDGFEFYRGNDKNVILNLVIESTQGLSETEYNMASDASVKRELGITDIEVMEKTLSGNKARITCYMQNYQGQNIETIQFTFQHNGYAYIFTSMASNRIDDESLASIGEILGTINFSN